MVINNNLILCYVQCKARNHTWTLPITYSTDLVVVGTTGNGTCNTYKNNLSQVSINSYQSSGNSNLMAISIGY